MELSFLITYNANMKYKLLALDVDDTIVESNTDIVPQPVHDAIQKAVNMGVVVAIVTARAKDDFHIIEENLNLPTTYHVLENGAKIIDPKGNIIRNLHIPDQQVQEILNVTAPYFEEVGFCTDSKWIDEEIDVSDKIVTGLSFTCYDPMNSPLLVASIRTLQNEYAIYETRHWSGNAEWTGVLLFHKDATKGKGMHVIQEKLGITAEETIACGDGATDVTMFEYAGLKVAMENGEEVLKNQADVIAPDVKNNGLVSVIEKYILNT